MSIKNDLCQNPVFWVQHRQKKYLSRPYQNRRTNLLIHPWTSTILSFHFSATKPLSDHPWTSAILGFHLSAKKSLSDHPRTPSGSFLEASRN